MKKTFSPTYKKLNKLFIAAVTAASLSLTGGGAAAPLLSAIGAGPVVARAMNSVSYREASWDSGTNTVTYTGKTADNVIEITSSSVTWTDGWYVVSNTETIADRITVSGNVKLILADGKTLTASKGITVEGNRSLTIYAQAEGTGKLIATHPNDNSDKAAIGRNGFGKEGGSVAIHGGCVEANVDATYTYATISGIGGNLSVGSTITIYGGTVTAYGNGGGGISAGSNGSVNIYGGAVTAIDTGIGAGIGGDNNHGCGTITIAGGTVNAQGRDQGAGIGNAKLQTGGTISITGGTITAGSNGGAAIGSGLGLSSGHSYIDGITISGGTVTAQEIDISGTVNGIGIIGNDAGKSDPVTVQITGDTSLSGSVKNMEVTAGKTLTVPSGSELKVTGTLTNNGTVTNSGTMTVASGGTVAVAENATLTVSSTGSLTNNGSVTVATGGTATVESGGTFVGTNPAGGGTISGFLPVLTVTANDKTITYGDAPNSVADGVTYSGFVDSDTADSFDHSGTLSYSYNYAQYGNVGAYTITPAGLTSTKYNISYATGTLTVEKKEVGLSWDESTDLTFNGSPQAPTARATELVNGDEIAVTVSTQTNAGTGYTATATGLTGTKAGNYKLPTTGKTHTFSIAKAAEKTLADVTKSVAVGATSFTASVANVMPTNAGTLSYAMGGTTTTKGNVTISSWAVDASGTVTATFSGGASGDSFTLPVTITSTNYADSTVKVVARLTANPAPAPAPSGGDTPSYEPSTDPSQDSGSSTDPTPAPAPTPEPAPSADTPGTSTETTTDPETGNVTTTTTTTITKTENGTTETEIKTVTDSSGNAISETKTETVTDDKAGTETVTAETKDYQTGAVTKEQTVTDIKTGASEKTSVTTTIDGTVTGITTSSATADGATTKTVYIPVKTETDKLTLTAATVTGSGEVTVPSGIKAADGKTYTVTGIGPRAFKADTSIVNVTIPSTVTEIGQGAFNGATSVQSITIYVEKAGKLKVMKNAVKGLKKNRKVNIHCRNRKQFDKTVSKFKATGGMNLKYVFVKMD